MVYGWLQGKVHLSNTIKPVKIENLVVERAVKRIRRYAKEVEEVSEFYGFVSENGFYCVLKQSYFPLLKLPCFHWKSCMCGNVGCWVRLQKLLRGVEVGER